MAAAAFHPAGSASWRVLLLCLAFRLVNALCTGCTVFNPDEYWQSMEVAYKHVWTHGGDGDAMGGGGGGGFLPWEFQAHAKLRGFAHPLVFVAFYSVLRRLGLDSTWMVANGPRLVQAVFAGVGDYYLYRLGFRLAAGRRGARWTLFCSWVNWFMFFCLTRTLSNSMECSLLMGALYYWPDTSGWRIPTPGAATPSELASYERSRRITLVLAAIIFVIRPTNAVIWVLLGAIQLWSAPGLRSRVVLVCDVVWIAVVTIGLSSFVDTVCYEALARYPLAAAAAGQAVGAMPILDAISYPTLAWEILTTRPLREWTLVALNFLRLNSGTDLARLYGTHPWHWYGTEGLPTNLGTMLPVFGWAMYKFVRAPDEEEAKEEGSRGASDGKPRTATLAGARRRSLWILFSCLVWCIATYSLNAHKEFRFILCVTPVAFLFVARAIAELEGEDEEREERKATEEQKESTSSLPLDADQTGDAPREGLRHRATPSQKQLAASPRPPSTPSTASSSIRAHGRSNRRIVGGLVVFLLTTNVLLGGYFTFVHQSGPRRVFARLNEILRSEPTSSTAVATAAPAAAGSVPTPLHHRIYFLMNCHTMPLSTFAHQPERERRRRGLTYEMIFLDCAPLFVDGALFRDGANPCSPSARLGHPDGTPDSFFPPSSSSPSSSVSSPSIEVALELATNQWWTTSEYRLCLHRSLNITLMDGGSGGQLADPGQLEGGGVVVNNEHYGSKAFGPRKRKRADDHSVRFLHDRPVRTTVVMTDAVLERYGHRFDEDEWTREDFFHSHLDDIKRFTVLTKKSQPAMAVAPARD